MTRTVSPIPTDAVRGHRAIAVAPASNASPAAGDPAGIGTTAATRTATAPRAAIDV